METVNLTINGDIKSMALKPGDVVVVRLPMKVSREIIAHMRSDLESLFPDNKVLVLDMNIDLSVVVSKD